MAGPLSEFPASQSGQSLRVLLWEHDLVDMWMLDERGERVPFRGKGSVWHAHADSELTCITAGDGILQVGDHSGRFSAPDCLLIGSELPHVWKARGTTAGVSVQFRSDSVPLLAAPELSPGLRLWPAARHGLRWHGQTAMQVREQLMQLEGQSAVQRLSKFLTIIEMMWHGYPAEAESLSARAHSASTVGVQDRALGRALDYIIEHYTDDLRLDDIVRMSACSPATFARRFSRMTGMSFIDYVHALRVQEVQRALIESDRSVTDIAFSSGFNNIAHFNTIFRRLVGCTPSVYRRQQHGH